MMSSSLLAHIATVSWLPCGVVQKFSSNASAGRMLPKMRSSFCTAVSGSVPTPECLTTSAARPPRDLLMPYINILGVIEGSFISPATSERHCSKLTFFVCSPEKTRQSYVTSGDERLIIVHHVGRICRNPGKGWKGGIPMWERRLMLMLCVSNR